MAKLIKGAERGQLVLFNECIEDRIASDNEVRVIDLFVESLDLEEIGFTKCKANESGTNHYDDSDMLKLYLYGYRHKVRSSRKLNELCRVNIEVMWLVRGITPDHRTIADFRKDHLKELKEMFRKLIITCSKLDLITNEFSQDGVKVEAVNSKDRNYTLNKLDDRLKRIEEYLKEMDKEDEKEKEEEKKEEFISKEELEERIKKEKEQAMLKEKIEQKKKKKKEYESIREELEKAGENQKSLTDKDAKLMKNNEKFSVCYNTQVLVDANTHIVANYEVDNNPADVGHMSSISTDLKDMLGLDEVITNVTDKGYNDRDDMASCLEEGIIPEVTLPEDKEYYEIEVKYEENEIKEEERRSGKAEDIKKCLRAGIIPEMYEEFISDIRVEERIETITVKDVENSQEELSEEEIRDFALQNECFTRTIEKNRVYCPAGEILRQKSKHKDGIKYCNKEACKRCKKQCTTAKYKEVVFSDGQTIVTRDKELKKSFPQPSVEKKKEKVKKVVFKLRPKKEDTNKRMGISEHPHGTMKRTDDASYFLMKSKEKVEAELALYYCASNLRRMINIRGVEALIRYFKEIIANKGSQTVLQEG